MPAIEGYTFKGWYQDGSKKKVSSIPAKKYSSFADAKINAVYVENVYNIDYKMLKPQGVKGAKIIGKPVKQKKIKYTEKVKLSSEEILAKTKEDKKTVTPERTYKVAGWTTEKNGTTIMYEPGAEVSKCFGKTKKDKKVILYIDVLVDNLEFVDYDTFEDVTTLRENTLVAIAARVENVRLIDNILLGK